MDLSKILNPQNSAYITSNSRAPGQPSVNPSGPLPGSVLRPFDPNTFQEAAYFPSVFEPSNAITFASPVFPEGLTASKTPRHESRLLPSPSQSPKSLYTETSGVAPSSLTPVPADSIMSNQTPKCEFSDGPCVTGGDNLRKVISHIFGRNKNCTKLFPQHVWIYYCRKHYQRARYRASVWPFTQCDLLMDSLDRMESWGGVESFELVLRRRETRRTLVGNQGERNEQNISTSGLQTPEASSPNSTISFAQTDDTQTYDNAAQASLLDQTTQTNETPVKRPPYIPPSPVPDWLREEVGLSKSFDDVRNMVERLRDYMAMVQSMDEKVMFPDIEILPRFRPGLIMTENDHVVSTKEGSRLRTPSHTAPRSPAVVSRVGRKGGIQKITKQ